MNKFIRFGFFGGIMTVFLVSGILIAGSGIVYGESNTATTPYTQERSVSGLKMMKYGEMKLDAKTKAEIDTAIQTGNARCAAVANETEKKACATRLETAIKARLQAVGATGMSDSGKSAVFNSDDKPMMTPAQSTDDDGKRTGKDDFRKFSKNFSERFENVLTNFRAVHDRIAKLADRVESRLSKLSAEGIDVSAGLKFTASARAELKLAETSIINAKTIFGEIFTAVQNKKTDDQSDTDTVSADTDTDTDDETSDTEKNPRAPFIKAIEQIRITKEHLIKAHRNLVQAIVSIKPGINKSDDVKSNMKSNPADPSAGVERQNIY